MAEGFKWPSPAQQFILEPPPPPPPPPSKHMLVMAWFTTLLHHVADVWRLLMALVLALVIHVVYAWLPSALAFVCVVMAVYRIGAYSIVVKERRPKRD